MGYLHIVVVLKALKLSPYALWMAGFKIGFCLLGWNIILCKCKALPYNLLIQPLCSILLAVCAPTSTSEGGCYKF